MVYEKLHPMNVLCLNSCLATAQIEQGVLVIRFVILPRFNMHIFQICFLFDLQEPTSVKEKMAALRKVC